MSGCRMSAVAAVLALGAALGAPGSPADAARDSVIRTDDRGVLVSLGTWKVRAHPSLRAAIAAFGRPDLRRRSEHYDFVAVGCRGGSTALCTCLVEWKALGARAVFRYRTQGEVPGCSGRGEMIWFKASGRAWRTDAGLRVGDRVSRIPTLYPCGRYFDGQSIWLLTPGARTTAEPAAGRVNSLRAVRSGRYAPDVPLSAWTPGTCRDIAQGLAAPPDA